MAKATKTTTITLTLTKEEFDSLYETVMDSPTQLDLAVLSELNTAKRS